VQRAVTDIAGERTEDALGPGFRTGVPEGEGEQPEDAKIKPATGQAREEISNFFCVSVFYEKVRNCPNCSKIW